MWAIQIPLRLLKLNSEEITMMWTLQRKVRHYKRDGKPATLILQNDIQWTGDMGVVAWAINLREPQDDIIAASIPVEKESTISHDELIPDEWQELHTLLEILQPFKKWTLILQHRNTPAMLANVVPAYDELLTHQEDQRVYQSSLEHSTPHHVAAITSAWTKLHRQMCKSTIGCVTRTRAHAQLIASFPWTPARRAAYSHL
jgi:hypothetical protein